MNTSRRDSVNLPQAKDSFDTHFHIANLAFTSTLPTCNDIISVNVVLKMDITQYSFTRAATEAELSLVHATTIANTIANVAAVLLVLTWQRQSGNHPFSSLQITLLFSHSIDHRVFLDPFDTVLADINEIQNNIFNADSGADFAPPFLRLFVKRARYTLPRNTEQRTKLPLVTRHSMRWRVPIRYSIPGTFVFITIYYSALHCCTADSLNSKFILKFLKQFLFINYQRRFLPTPTYSTTVEGQTVPKSSFLLIDGAVFCS